MKRPTLIISRYLLQNVLPYFVFGWLLLSVVLFVQQASRYSDIFFSVHIPSFLVWQLTFALVPNVIAFTAPMAVLLGVIIGLSKMQGDSELTAIRASGVGNFQIALPIILLGVLLSGFAFFINLKGVPFAANMVRRIALQTALYKLESPIEPGVFNTEIGGYTIYVRSGDNAAGEWNDIFIYNEDANNNQMRLITSSKGKIDSTLGDGREYAELVLEDAVSTTLPLNTGEVLPGGARASTENLGSLRLSIRTKRDDVVKKLTESKEIPEELGLGDLGKLAQSADPKEAREAHILWQRRLLLSVTPLIFSILGTVLVLRFNRSGRGFGVVLALVSLIGYYSVTLIGEQLARSGKVWVTVAGLLPLLVSSLMIWWFSVSSRILGYRGTGFESIGKWFSTLRTSRSRSGLVSKFSTGIGDVDILSTVIRYYVLTVVFLASIYLIFTTFEMWKFAGAAPNGIELLAKYLFYLVPFIYLQLAPSAGMIAVLATFVVKSRQNEVVTWTAAGQSVYRLLLPAFLLMAVLGLFNWLVQEYVAPRTNRKQDTIRAQIRNKGILAVREGRYWVANNGRMFSFERPDKLSGSNNSVSRLAIYEFDSSRRRLKAVYRAEKATWNDGRVELEDVRQSQLGDQALTCTNAARLNLDEAENPFDNLNQKASHLTSAETRSQLAESESESESRSLAVALQRKYTTPFVMIVIAIFTAPFALSLSRKGKVVTVGYAIGLWLVYMGVSNWFEQLGLSGNLTTIVAVWSPLVLFLTLGTFLFSRVRT